MPGGLTPSSDCNRLRALETRGATREIGTESAGGDSIESQGPVYVERLDCTVVACVKDFW